VRHRWGAKGIFLPLERRDLLPPCDRTPELELCKGAVAEVNRGDYGVLRCNDDIGGNKSVNYSLWSKTVPAALVELARKASRAAVKALGDKAVEDCRAGGGPAVSQA
jgi:hypothetical protein